MKNFISAVTQIYLFWVASWAPTKWLKWNLGSLFRKFQKFQVVYVELAPSPQLSWSFWHLRSKLRPREERRIAQNPMLCKGQRQALNSPSDPGTSILSAAPLLLTWPDYLGWMASILHVGLALRRRNLQFKTKDFIWTRRHSSHDDQRHWESEVWTL